MKKKDIATSWQELHDQVEIVGVLEGVIHLDHPGVVRLHQYVSLCSHVRNLDKKMTKNADP